MTETTKKSRLLKIAAPWGWLSVQHENGWLLSVDLDCEPEENDDSSWDSKDQQVANQFLRYLQSSSRIDLPLILRGTDFQRSVWQALASIPSGQVRTYGDLARELGSGARAVSNACRANPVPLVVPCHRAVAANGRGGFMGARSGRPLMIKQWLLEHEGVG